MPLSYRSLKPEEKSFGVGIHGLASRVFGKKISNTSEEQLEKDHSRAVGMAHESLLLWSAFDQEAFKLIFFLLSAAW